MMKKDKSFEYLVAEYMVTRFLDFMDTISTDITLIRLARKGKSDPRKLGDPERHLLVLQFAKYIDKRLNKPIFDKKYGELDKHMSILFKNR